MPTAIASPKHLEILKHGITRRAEQYLSISEVCGASFPRREVFTSVSVVNPNLLGGFVRMAGEKPHYHKLVLRSLGGIFILIWCLLWSLFRGLRGKSDFGCRPTESFLLSPVLSMIIYSATAYAVLSFVARRTRLR